MASNSPYSNERERDSGSQSGSPRSMRSASPNFDGAPIDLSAVTSALPAAPPPPPEPPKPPRIFITHADSYTGKRLAARLAATSYVPLQPIKAVDPDASIEYSAHEDDESGAETQAIPAMPFVVVATLAEPAAPGVAAPAGVSEVVSASGPELLAVVQTCDVIVYDVLSNVAEGSWLIEQLAEASDSWPRPKVFVCLSSVMTWGKTSHIEEDAQDESAFVEEDYKRRKPHPAFKDHVYAEKLALKWGHKKPNFRAMVIARGLVYGGEEELFHFLFKMAWHGNPKALPVIGRGRNIMPMVHVEDLATIVARLIAEKPAFPYHLAVDEGRLTSTDVVQAIADALGSGQVKRVKKDDALLLKDLSALQLDMLQLNVALAPNLILEYDDMPWVARGGFVESIRAVVAEFRSLRGLTPLRMAIYGPPASGKSFYASRIAKEYKVHHLELKPIIDEYLAALRAGTDPADAELLAAIDGATAEAGGRIPDEFVVPMVRKKLLSMPAQNQGFVLDGFPKTLAQAQALYELGDDVDESVASEAADPTGLDKRILPEFVFVLRAADPFLRARIRELPEAAVAESHNTEAGLNRRLEEFRAINTDERSVWDFYDEREILPLYVEVAESTQPKRVMADVSKLVGKPHNYGPSKKEQAARERQVAEEEAKIAAEQAAIREEQQAAEAAAKAEAERQWAFRLDVLRRDEEAVLASKSQPLREYLMAHVMPTLTSGLVEVCKVRPDDPISYLAEILFRANPVETGETPPS